MNTIDDILSRMTVREKVGQCIQIELDKIDFRSPDATAEWFARYPAGSIVKGPDVAGVANGGRPVNADAVERCVAATKIPLTVCRRPRPRRRARKTASIRRARRAGGSCGGAGMGAPCRTPRTRQRLPLVLPAVRRSRHAAPTPETQRVLVRLLYGELPFCGKSPFRQSINLGVQE